MNFGYLFSERECILIERFSVAFCDFLPCAWMYQFDVRCLYQHLGLSQH